MKVKIKIMSKKNVIFLINLISVSLFSSHFIVQTSIQPFWMKVLIGMLFFIYLLFISNFPIRYGYFLLRGQGSSNLTKLWEKELPLSLFMTILLTSLFYSSTILYLIVLPTFFIFLKSIWIRFYSEETDRSKIILLISFIFGFSYRFLYMSWNYSPDHAVNLNVVNNNLNFLSLDFNPNFFAYVPESSVWVGENEDRSGVSVVGGL